MMMKNRRKTGSTSFHTKVQVAVEHKLRQKQQQQQIAKELDMEVQWFNHYQTSIFSNVCLKNAVF